MATNELARLLDWDAIVRLAGSVYVERGLSYVEEGRVGPITESDEAIEATVTGEYPYSVRIAAVGSSIIGLCSCPMGETGVFCKHCVALAVWWAIPSSRLRELWSGRTVSRGRGGRPDDVTPWSDDAIRPYLEGLDRDELLDLISGQMARHDDLAEHLRLRAAVSAASQGGTAELRQALDRATLVRGYLPYAEVTGFAHDVHAVADAVEDLVEQGQADEAIDLAERGLRRVESAILESDDSDGLLGDLLRRFEDIHLVACRTARPDPIPLARRLFKWELEGDFDVFRGAAERYADVLGQAGLAEYRRLAQERWSRVPARGPGDARRSYGDDDSSSDFGITYMMESLARASGDIDELIAVMGRDLSHEYDYIRVAGVCREHGRDDEALEWAERGLRAFPKRTDVRLREFLADEYLRRSRDDEAMALLWSELLDEHDLASYRLLKRFADRIGAWDSWRPRAFEEVRRAVEAAIAAPSQERPRFVRYEVPDGSTIVEILAWEGRIDEAWAEARRLGCRSGVMMQLAKQSEETRPEDALAVYRDEVADILKVAGRRAYAEAVSLLHRIRVLMSRLGQEEQFRSYAAEVRAANARRPAFRSMFDAAGFLEAPRRGG